MTLGALKIILMVFFIPLFGDFSIFVGFLCWRTAIEYSLCKSVSEYSAQCTVFFGPQERCPVHLNISSISYLYLIFHICIIAQSLLSISGKMDQLVQIGGRCLKEILVMPESKRSILAGTSLCA